MFAHRDLHPGCRMSSALLWLRRQDETHKNALRFEYQYPPNSGSHSVDLLLQSRPDQPRSSVMAQMKTVHSMNHCRVAMPWIR